MCTPFPISNRNQVRVGDLICSGLDAPESPANSEQLQAPKRTPAISTGRRYRMNNPLVKDTGAAKSLINAIFSLARDPPL